MHESFRPTYCKRSWHVRFIVIFMLLDFDAFAQSPANSPLVSRFTDITVESGIAAIVADKYAASPKWWLSGLHLVDLDSDGDLDLFLSAHGGGGAVAALNDGKGNFTFAQGNWPTTEIHLAADIDEDGKADLSMTFQDGGGKWWLNRSQPGRLDFQPTNMERGTNTARRQSLIDLNRDGKADWLRGAPRAIIFEFGDAPGHFVNDSGSLPTGNKGRSECLCLPCDSDGDGFIDLLVEYGHYDNALGHSRVFRNDGKMNFSDVTTEIGLPETAVAIKGAGDVNRDGTPDLFVLENRKPELYLNNGRGKFTKRDGTFAEMPGASKPTYASWGLAVVTDFDNDGNADIIWNGKHFLWLFQGDGTGGFQYMNKQWGIKDLSASSVDDGLCFGDIDGDGDLDIVGYTAMGDRRLFGIYRNDLPRQNWLRVRPVGLPGNKSAGGAKIRVYDPGTSRLVTHEQVAIHDSQAAASYYAFAETERHFGLGKLDAVDVSVEFYPSGTKVERKNVAANAVISIREAGR